MTNQDQLLAELQAIKEIIAQSDPASQDLTKIYAALQEFERKLDLIIDTTGDHQTTLTNLFSQYRSHHDKEIEAIRETRVEIARDQAAMMDRFRMDAKNSLTIWSAINMILMTHATAIIIFFVASFAGLGMGLVTEPTVKAVWIGYGTGLSGLAMYLVKVWVDSKLKKENLRKEN